MIPFPFNRGEFTPLTLKPVFANTGLSGWRNAGGSIAGYLDTVATFINRGTHPNDGVQPTANSQPVCLAHSGRNYLHCSGVAGNYASAPVGASAAVTSWIVEIDGNFRLNGGDQSLFFGGAFVFINGAGQYVTNGFVGWSGLPATGDQILRFVYDGVQIEAFHKAGDVWVSDGATALTGVHDWSGTAWFGSENSGSAWNVRGAYRRVTFWDQLDDSLDPVLDIPFDTFADRATSGVAATGQTVTINQSGGNPATLVGRPLLRFDGVDDKFTVPGLALDGPMTFIYVATWSSKDSIAWADPGDGGRYATSAINDAVTVTDAPPAGIGSYRKNGSALGSIATRGDLYAELENQRVLLIDQFTFSSGGTDSGFSAYVGLEFRGDLEAIYIYPRIVPLDELAKIETYETNKRGPF